MPPPVPRPLVDNDLPVHWVNVSSAHSTPAWKVYDQNF